MGRVVDRGVRILCAATLFPDVELRSPFQWRATAGVAGPAAFAVVRVAPVRSAPVAHTAAAAAGERPPGLGASGMGGLVLSQHETTAAAGRRIVADCRPRSQPNRVGPLRSLPSVALTNLTNWSQSSRVYYKSGFLYSNITTCI